MPAFASRSSPRGPRGRVAGWGLWSLPRAAVGWVIGVDLAALVALGLAAQDSALRAADLGVVAVLALCGLASVEGSRHLGAPSVRHDRPYKDMLSAWMLPVVLLLPPVYAVLIPVPIYLMVQLRVTRIPPVKRVFNAASVGLAGYAASVTHGWLADGRGPYGPEALLGSLRGLIAVLAAAAVYSAVSAYLVAGVLRRVSPGMPRRFAFAGWPLQATEAAELCLGVLVALACALWPLLAVLAVPPMLLLQRTLLHAELLQAARTDAKTGLSNPRHWREVAEREVARALRGGRPLAVLLADLDGFKTVNDSHGHLVGDRVLTAVAEELKAGIRPLDLVGRFGGEEFVVLLPDAAPETAVATAHRLRARVEQLAPPLGRGGAPLKITISIGVATLGDMAEDLTGLLEAADGACLAAKRAGRNRVCIAPAPLPGASASDWTVQSAAEELPQAR